MKKIYLSSLISLLILSTFTPLGVSAEKNKQLNVYEKGLYESANTTSTEISPYEVEITTVEGVPVEGDFHISENTFYGELIFDGETYLLEGNNVLQKGMKYFEFEGKVSDGENKKFHAYVEKEKQKKYRMTLNILTFDLTDSNEPTDGQTFIFDGDNTPKTTKEKRIVKSIGNSYKSESSNSLSTIAATGSSHTLALYYGTYMDTLVQGSSILAQGQMDYHAIRSTTHSDSVNNYWNNQDWYYNARDTEVIDYWVELSTEDLAGFSTEEPANSSITYFKVPVYLGTIIGRYDIPVKVSATTISGGAGRSYLNYHFDNPGYVDDSSVTSETSNAGFGVRYAYDTDYLIEPGYTWVYATTKMKYRTTVDSGYNWYWVYKDTSNSVNYLLDIAENN